MLIFRRIHCIMQHMVLSQFAVACRYTVLTQAVYRQATMSSRREWQYHMLHVYNCILLKMSIYGSKHVCIYEYIGFKTFFYAVRHLDSVASYLPTGLYLGFCRPWPSLFLPSSFSSVFLVLSFVSASTSMLFWVVFLLQFFEHGHIMWAGSVQSPL